MKTTRALTTFAYVADEFGKTKDIAQGLVPLFAPLISRRAGAPFDPVLFVQDLKATYDLEVHPFVAEAIAPSLAARGYLTEDHQPGAIHYTNRACDLPELPIHENQLRDLVDGFLSFAETRLTRAGSKLEDDQLETSFFDRLIQPDFLGLLLRPDRPAADPNILTLKRPQRKQDEATNLEQQLDYLVASYILHVSRSTPDRFDLIVAAASGALVAEVVLDLQHPVGDPLPMSGANVAIDSPLVLDAMELGHDGATPYALELIEQIKKAGARPITFGDTMEKIRGALTAPLKRFERNEPTYGPLGRRLRVNRTVAAYIRSILPNMADVIQEHLGVDVLEISPTERAQRRIYFTETHES